MKKVSSFFVYLFISVSVIAAQPSQLVLDYIDTYKVIAIREMAEYKIPASITLAQGILESGAGQSELAKESNNHFGIKCHTDWKGDKVYHDDDEKGECFRKYDHVEESYRDHSEFLANKPRYAFLFELETDDYKAWAKGLKQAGYATNPKYADLLINMIEEYELYKYDKMTLADIKSDKHDKKDDKQKHTDEPKDKKKDQHFSWGGYGSNVFYFNRIPTITVRDGDTPEKIAEQNHIEVKRLYDYNDLNQGDELAPDSKFYLQPKRKKGETKFHVVKEGETLWTISRDEGVRLEKLYQYNLLKPGQEPAVGEEINLRKKRKEAPVVNAVNRTSKVEKTNIEELQQEEPEKDNGMFLFDEEELIVEPTAVEKAQVDSVVEPVKVIEEQKEEMKPGSQPQGAVKPVYHEVQAKETLYGLSKKYGVSIEQIQVWNSLPDHTLKIGQQLIVGYQ